MKIKLSKSKWEEMGKKAGWVKEAQIFEGRDLAAEDLINAIKNIVFALEQKEVAKIKQAEQATHLLSQSIKLLNDFVKIMDKDVDTSKEI